MATERSKVLRISHNQLSKLASKYDNEDQRGQESRQPSGKHSDRDDRDRPKRGKRPDIAIYRPGSLRQPSRRDTDNSEADDLSSADNYSGADRSSTEKEVESLTRSVEQVTVEDEGGGRRRKKKPDIPIYIPKHRQGEEEVVQGATSPLTQSGTSETFGQPSHGYALRSGRPGGEGSGHPSAENNISSNKEGSHAPGDERRRQNSSSKGSQDDFRYNSGNRQDPDNRRSQEGDKAPGGRGNDPGGRGGNNGNWKRDRKPRDNRRGGRGRGRNRGGRGGNNSAVNDTSYFSDASHDSLEWDYQAEVEHHGFVDIDDNYIATEVIFTNSKYAEGSEKPVASHASGGASRGRRGSREANKPERQVLLGHMVNDKDNEMEWDEMDEELAGPQDRRKTRKRKSKKKRNNSESKEGELGSPTDANKHLPGSENAQAGAQGTSKHQQSRTNTQERNQRQRRQESQSKVSQEAAARDNIPRSSPMDIVPSDKKSPSEGTDGLTEEGGAAMSWGDMVEAEQALSGKDPMDIGSMSWGDLVEAEMEREHSKGDDSPVTPSKPDASATTSSKPAHAEPYRPPAYRSSDSMAKNKGHTEKSRHNSGEHGRKSSKGRGGMRDRPSSRERHGSDSHGKDRSSGSKANLKVTFAENERHVNISGSRASEERDVKGRRGRDDSGLDSHAEGRGGGRGRKGRDQGPSSPKGSNVPPAGRGAGYPPRGRGGIIRLPVNHNEPQPVTSSHVPQHVQQNRPPSRGRGRGSSRILYDPNNPNKPLNTPAPLHFHDPYDPACSPPAHFHPGYDYHGGGGRHYEGNYHGEYSSSPHGHGDSHGYGFPHPAYEAGACLDDVYSKDPYYHSETHEVDNSGRMRSASRAEAEAILRKTVPLDGQLSGLVARGFTGMESFANIMRLRQEVQFEYERVILMDSDLANRHNVEQLLWKAAFYTIIEALRRHDQEHPEDHANPCLLQLLDEGTAFYTGLLGKLQTTFGFSIDAFLDPTRLPPENLKRTVKLALLSTQRTFICLGDIARYREQAHRTCNYGLSRSLYLKAQQIAPKNGRPYNQLAILALYTRRKLDAVYYYMRSLAASNPFITARESLMSLFDDARKRKEASDQKKQQEMSNAKEEERVRKLSNEGNRVEVWVLPDGTSTDGQGNHMEESDITIMSVLELLKRFTLSFLHVHGMLFTKIGMECFPEVCSQMLHEFRELLNRSPPPLAHLRLLQIMAINMFAVENTTPKQNTLEENCRSLVQEQAVQVALDMAGLLVSRCAELFQEHLMSQDCRVMSDELHGLFPSVKVWADWMTCHAHLWNPPPIPRDPELGPVVDVWQSVAQLCNILKQVDITHVKLYMQKKEGCDPVILEEDLALAGFVPLLSAPQVPMYVHSTVEKDVSRNCLRIELLRTFGDYLCGIEPPMLVYDVETRVYVSAAPDSLNISNSSEGCAHQVSKDSDDIIIESEEEEIVVEGDTDEVRHLKARRQELQRTLADREEQQRRVSEVLQDTRHGARQHILEVSPVFLVPDTNCFIDHLAGLQALLNRTSYILVIPLIVINELDGLAKGQREGQYMISEHAHMVSNQAQLAVSFLESQFESRNGRLRALTSKGTTMNTIVFRSEETAEEGNNDDLILQCCLHYCKDKARDFMPKDRGGPIRIRREVVLLTDDRNLRLKAHTRNVPVRDIPAFLKWVKIT